MRTLIDLCAAFDVGLVVKFVPFSVFLGEYEDVSTSAMSAPSFEQDIDLLSGIGEISQFSYVQAFIPIIFLPSTLGWFPPWCSPNGQMSNP